MVRRLVLITASFLFFIFPYVAISAPIASVVGEFEEHYSKEVPVSGNVIAGIMVSTQDVNLSNIFSPSVLVIDSNSLDRFFCLSVVSVDGIYSSRNTYQLPNNITGGFVVADYSKSEYLELLEQAGKDFAVKAVPGKCMSESESTYFVSNASTSSKIDEISFLIDSIGATDIVLAARDESKKRFYGECEPIIGDRKTGFDYRCKLPLTDAVEGSLDVRIQRIRYDRRLKPISIKVII
ncbi:hypothetical protein [Marinomonas sp. ef1]|uniref:hypothetical protein n=1 Tax=Marinomonas sp. ef1 TaxID=2005043 RepID=UPI000C286225|nr:hypothetical protein [Marinomonas sp. ef1]